MQMQRINRVRVKATSQQQHRGQARVSEEHMLPRVTYLI
jgi:hypothetical protein